MSNQPSTGPIDQYSGPQIPPSFSQVLQALQAISDLFQKQYTAGNQVIQIDILTIGTTGAPLYAVPKLVRGGTIMNLSATDTITLGGGGIGQQAKALGLVAGQGYLLNPSNVAGMGGGTFNFGNIDLSSLIAVTNLNAAQKIAVVYYL